MNNTINVITQFIPIVFIFSLISYTQPTILFCHSILGKIIAIIIIAFYSYLDKYVGLFVCALVVLFYQLNIVENSLNIFEKEAFVDYMDEYDDNVFFDTPKSHTTFRDRNCKNGDLEYKNMKVKPDMADVVFPELEFKNDPCNPCVSGCKFSIIEAKMNTQDELKPIHSRP